MTEDINQLQLLQQNLQNTILQKQQFQRQLTEVDSALKEIDTSENVYKIVSNLMISVKKPEIKQDLQQKRELFDLRLKNFEKQEKKLKENIEEMQKKVLENLKKNE